MKQPLTLELGDARGLPLSACLLFNRNSPAEAEAKLKTLSESVRARSPYRLKYAEVKAKGKTEESLAAAQSLTAEILKQAPDFLPALTLSAQLSFTRKNPAEAMATLEKVFAIDSENSEARLLQAKGWMVNGEAAKAVQSRRLGHPTVDQVENARNAVIVAVHHQRPVSRPVWTMAF